MNKKELQEIAGSQYQFRLIFTNDEVRQLQREKPSWLTYQTVLSLIAGCVRLDAVLFRDGDTLRLGYDLFVKDRPNADEWICYDNPEEAVCLDEDSMCSVLDQLVKEHGLSYTECCFCSLDKNEVKK